MLSTLAQDSIHPLETTISGAIVLCAITIATLLIRASIRREDKRATAYEKDLELRRADDMEDRKLRREAEKSFHNTIETLTRENHKTQVSQMRERTQLDSKNLEVLGVVSEAMKSLSQAVPSLQRSSDEILKIVQQFQCKGDDAA